ncbi:hypothetical protein MKW98_009952 [Papaver atlanticum]|uniref:Uncharacterized protein n=1 Tax=Papaver atlanticum TaxID=357466 RepID=A0AAD4T0V4_9MAGN|nr:hypothetical protein MKW98_009952 [Papaver atlanticum]
MVMSISPKNINDGHEDGGSESLDWVSSFSIRTMTYRRPRRIFISSRLFDLQPSNHSYVGNNFGMVTRVLAGSSLVQVPWCGHQPSCKLED